jgi:hypothetical protein
MVRYILELETEAKKQKNQILLFFTPTTPTFLILQCVAGFTTPTLTPTLSEFRFPVGVSASPVGVAVGVRTPSPYWILNSVGVVGVVGVKKHRIRFPVFLAPVCGLSIRLIIYTFLVVLHKELD